MKLDQTDLNNLINIRNANNGLSSGWASSILSYYGVGFTPTYNLDARPRKRVVRSDNSTTMSLTIYPNPSSQYLELRDIEESIIVDIMVLDMQGKLMSINSITSNKLDISSLKNGLYLLQVADLNGYVKTAKFIKI